MNEKKLDQILKNQATILRSILDMDPESLDTETLNSINDRGVETLRLLNPPQEESLNKKTEDALSGGEE